MKGSCGGGGVEMVLMPCVFWSSLILVYLTVSVFKSVGICRIFFKSLRGSKFVEICRFLVSG
jgi:hypothetical protein